MDRGRNAGGKEVCIGPQKGPLLYGKKMKEDYIASGEIFFKKRAGGGGNRHPVLSNLD